MTIKKSLIAIAVSSAFMVPVAAQAAEAYGRVNLNLQSTNDDAEAVGTSGKIGMSQTTSHFGFRAEEDLGNGLSVMGRYEINIDATDGTTNDTSRLSYVGLSGDFGTVKAGKMYGTFYNHVGVVTDLGWLQSSPAYYSLTDGMGGVGYQLREQDTLQYTNSAGPVSFGIEGQFDNNDAPDADGDTEAVDRIALSGQFDAGVATFGLGHWTQSNAPSGAAEPSSTGVSAIVPVGPGDIRASYVSVDQDSASGNNDNPSALDVLGTISFDGGWYAHAGVGQYDNDQDDDQGDFTYILAMVSKSLGSGASIYGEFQTQSVDGGNAGSDLDPRVFNVGINYNF